MKKRAIYPIMALAIALAGCSPKFGTSQNIEKIGENISKPWVNPNLSEIDATYKIIWSADKFSKVRGKHLYEKILPNIQARRPMKPEVLEDCALDMWLLMGENRQKFLETGNRDYALKAMGYAQYISVISPSRREISKIYITDLENRLSPKN